MVNKGRLHLLSLTLGAVLTVCLPLGVMAEDWSQRLMDMAHAAERYDYSGTLIFAHDDQVKTLRVNRHRGEKGMYEYIQALDGSPRQVVREGRRVTCIMPDSQAVLVRNGGLPGTAAKLAALDMSTFSHSYAIHSDGSDRIADRDTDVLAIEPMDALRYGYRIWQDKETGLLMRFDVVRKDGQRVESMMFSEFQLGAKSIKTRAEVAVNHRPEGMPLLREEGWSVSTVPHGFRQIVHRQHGENGSRLDQWVFSDGLASLSLFIEAVKAEVDSGLPEQFSMGALNAWSRLDKQYRITAIGEVPASTVRALAESVSKP